MSLNYTEVGDLLARIAVVDSRTVDAATIALWHDLLALGGRITLVDAVAAVDAHRVAKPGVWLEPGHVIAGVKTGRRRRLAAAPADPSPPDDLDPRRYATWLDAYRTGIGDGLDPARADAEACRTVGVTRSVGQPIDPARVRAVIAGVTAATTRQASA